MVENVTENKVKVLRTDQGLEEVNKDVADYLKKKGIRHKKSCTYTPQQNGRIERENRTVGKLARRMLYAKNTKKEFWDEAVNTAVFVLKRSGTSSAKGKSPYELWYNKTLDIKNFQIFGADAYVLVPKSHRRKQGYNCDFSGKIYCTPINNV
ncbi:Retrovirus-related Pol polyprotein from transposon TNT 1-94 [Araneus ventricosus]|uniref:Retrovirus-related Pol polyprotein from transposon TNT 1-94 n=1 Tax=Araneus ventricosus TaxID=182803 RepID=A0A4Y2TJB3_ARAVE|nr:Retrovirus-related Pol polyprotein from transposon TNT 1-94 [Araneus ventricosus]